MDDKAPRLSCIAIVDFSQDIRFVYVTESFSDLLGWGIRETIGRSGSDLVHPDEFSVVRELHYDTIRQDKAAVLAYLRLKHKDPLKGYLLCVISRTVVHNVLVGSISPATTGAKALQNAATAQEVDFVTPVAMKDFEFRYMNFAPHKALERSFSDASEPTPRFLHAAGGSARCPAEGRATEL
ncbi:hypothetical protein ID866_2213 [Astraeus odoratus]|nr:hypothetical protein ID866_2213 [Astraeus odoratus]